MGAEHWTPRVENEIPERLSVPPGFTSLSSFFLKKVENLKEKNFGLASLKTSSTQDQRQVGAKADMIDVEKLKESVGNRPWILYGKSDQIAKDSQPIQPDKKTASQCPGDVRSDDIKEAPVFHPSEEEFNDALKYIESIHFRAEPSGLCRIIPPPSWQPPCLIKEKRIWEYATFVTHYQRFERFPAHSVENKTAESCSETSKTRSSVMSSEQTVSCGYSRSSEEVGCLDMDCNVSKPCSETGKTRSSVTSSEQTVSCGYSRSSEEAGCLDMDCNVSKPGPEFTLKTFKKYADDFKQQYFFSKHKGEGNGNGNQEEPSEKSIEHEYRQLIENPTGVLEVLYGDKLDTGTSSSGFPMTSDPWELYNYPRYIRSNWNLTNLPKLPGSLLSFGSDNTNTLLVTESDNTNTLLVPQLRTGMCFSSLFWRVEEHYLYSMCYMHMGSPKFWYFVPGKYSFKFEAFVKKYHPDLLDKQFKLHQGVITGISPFMLKSEGIPVYHCIQRPREFVLVSPGTYYSAFDCGFNVVETVNFASLDWLPHGQNAVALYQERQQKTLISFDKLLIGAARNALWARWEMSVQKKNTNNNLSWESSFGKKGILLNTLKSRVKQEVNRREYLCTSHTKRMDKNFDGTVKRECSICFFDLYLSAAYCSCSPNRYSCLNHAKQLCSCAWTERIFLCRYNVSELNDLVEGLDGNLTAMYRWARGRNDQSLGYYIPRENSHAANKAKKEPKFKDEETSLGNGQATSSIKAEIRARIEQSLNVQKSEEKTVSTPSLPCLTQDDTSFLFGEKISEALSSSTSSLESEDSIDLGLNVEAIGYLSSSSSRPPGRAQREVILSEFLNDTPRNGEAKRPKLTPQGRFGTMKKRKM